MQEKLLDFSKYSSIKIGPKIPIKIAQNLKEAICLYQQDYFIIGKANNILLSPKKHKIFQLGKEFDYICDLGISIEVGARCNNRKIFLYFKENDLAGLEFLKNIPGSIGGIVKMNAGMKQYEIKHLIQSVCINGQWRKDIDFSYRNSNIEGIITAVRLKKNKGFKEYLESTFTTMRSNQPKAPSAGSCFKNPKVLDFASLDSKALGINQNSISLDSSFSAGKLLDLVGLRGYKIGNMQFSNQHANFLINLGGGRFEDALTLINLAKKKVFEKFGITLVCEVIIL